MGPRLGARSSGHISPLSNLHNHRGGPGPRVMALAKHMEGGRGDFLQIVRLRADKRQSQCPRLNAARATVRTGIETLVTSKDGICAQVEKAVPSVPLQKALCGQKHGERNSPHRKAVEVNIFIIEKKIT